MFRQFYQRTIEGINIYKIVIVGIVFSTSSCNTNNIPADPGMEDNEVSISVTRWTENVELFVEFPPFIVGEETKFSAHFTDLRTYKPISAATVTVQLEGEETFSETVSKAARPGIFTPILIPGQSGMFQLKFEIRYGDIMEMIDAGQVQVYSSRGEAKSNIPAANEGGITFLKEQAWKTDFSVMPVMKQKVNERIRVAGELVSNPSKVSTLASTAAGMVVYSREFHPGGLVRKGEKIGVVIGKDIVAGVNAEENLQHVFLNAKASLAQTKANYGRQKQLFEEKVISSLEFEQYQLEYDLAQSEFETVSNNYVESLGGIELIAGTSGYIDEVLSQPGDYLEVGTPLMSLLPVNNKLLHLDIPADYYAKVDQIAFVHWQEDADWHKEEATIVSYSSQIEPGAAFFSVWVKVNPIDAVTGRFFPAEVEFSSPTQEMMVVPTRSILEDYGVYSVIVQVTGESFEKREIILGNRNSEFTQVLEGLDVGEMVVVDGAYQVKMASMAGEAPAHGHEH
jgi:RND family efflux transporter MFP subunit